MDTIIIANYDPHWPELFEQEAVNLQTLLPRELILRVEHVGSTAIPGMAAKPVIDMLVEISSFDLAQQIAIPRLQAKGYEYIWRSDRPPGQSRKFALSKNPKSKIQNPKSITLTSHVSEN